MAINKVEICGLDTSKLPMMTYERSRELLLKIKDGDECARETFIRENLRLVLSVIQRFYIGIKIITYISSHNCSP